MKMEKSPEAIEIERYLNIINGNTEHTVCITNNIVVENHFGNIGDVYSYDNGSQWVKINEDRDTGWLIDIGYTSNEPYDSFVIDKSEISSLIVENKLSLIENISNQVVNESETFENNAYNIFLEKVGHYLYKHYQQEMNDFNIDWENLYESGYGPSDAAEYAIIG